MVGGGEMKQVHDCLLNESRVAFREGYCGAIIKANHSLMNGVTQNMKKNPLFEYMFVMAVIASIMLLDCWLLDFNWFSHRLV